MTRKDKTSRLEKLRKHWQRASEEERSSFLSEVMPAGSSSDRHITEVRKLPIADGRYLLPHTIKRIETVLIRRGIGPKQAASEIGFPAEAVALTRALAKGRSLRLTIIAALTRWLDDNET